jgi:hypothetical protein
MSKRNDGGPAYPTAPEYDHDGYCWGLREYGQPGMSLRDWFAGQAVSAILTNNPILDILTTNDKDESTRYGAARYAYEVADAMLRAREETSNEGDTQ